MSDKRGISINKDGDVVMRAPSQAGDEALDLIDPTNPQAWLNPTDQKGFEIAPFNWEAVLTLSSFRQRLKVALVALVYGKVPVQIPHDHINLTLTGVSNVDD